MNIGPCSKSSQTEGQKASLDYLQSGNCFHCTAHSEAAVLQLRSARGWQITWPCLAAKSHEKMAANTLNTFFLFLFHVSNYCRGPRSVLRLHMGREEEHVITSVPKTLCSAVGCAVKRFENFCSKKEHFLSLFSIVKISSLLLPAPVCPRVWDWKGEGVVCFLNRRCWLNCL